MTLNEFKTLLGEQRSSGKSQKQFCHEKGLHYSIFQYWMRKGKKDSATAGPFIEIPFPRVQGSLEITFPNGLRVSLPAGMKVDTSLLKNLHAL